MKKDETKMIPVGFLAVVINDLRNGFTLEQVEKRYPELFEDVNMWIDEHFLANKS